jgi:hypothetical protein
MVAMVQFCDARLRALTTPRCDEAPVQHGEHHHVEKEAAGRQPVGTTGNVQQEQHPQYGTLEKTLMIQQRLAVVSGGCPQGSRHSFGARGVRGGLARGAVCHVALWLVRAGLKPHIHRFHIEVGPARGSQDVKGPLRTGAQAKVAIESSGPAAAACAARTASKATRSRGRSERHW